MTALTGRDLWIATRVFERCGAHPAVRVLPVQEWALDIDMTDAPPAPTLHDERGDVMVPIASEFVESMRAGWSKPLQHKLEEVGGRMMMVLRDNGTLLTTGQREALEQALAMPFDPNDQAYYGPNYAKHSRIIDALHAVYGNVMEEQARWLIAADDRIRGGG